MRGLVCLVGIAAMAAGCATRTAPYRFHGDLVGGITAKPAPDVSTGPVKPLRVEVARARQAPPKPTTTREPTLDEDAGEPTPLADTLRGLVGQRDKKKSDLQFAVVALDALGVAVDAKIQRVSSGRSLVTLARRRGALRAPGPALLGDLVVFDSVVGRRSASLVGVVVGSRLDGTIEFVYLTRGVVRRGYVNPDRPAVKRDAKGVVLNTFVRHSDGRDSRGTRYLAGRLFASVIRLDQLMR